jgi:hypothetical protein
MFRKIHYSVLFSFAAESVLIGIDIMRLLYNVVIVCLFSRIAVSEVPEKFAAILDAQHIQGPKLRKFSPTSEHSIVWPELRHHLGFLLEKAHFGLKVFVYPPPDSLPYNASRPCPLHLRGDRAIIAHLKKFSTTPENANIFLIEHDFNCEMHHLQASRRDNPISSHLQPIVKNVIYNYPYFNRSKGSDHLILATSNEFASIHGWDKIIQMLHNVSLVVNYGYPDDQWKLDRHGRNSHLDVPIPRYHQWSPAIPLKWFNTASRRHYIFFRGIYDTSYSGRINDIRTLLKPESGDESLRFVSVDMKDRTFRATPHADIQQAYSPAISYFSLCPPGYATLGVDLYDAISHVSIPVILDEETVFPFERFINWELFTVKVNSKTINRPNRSAFLEALNEKCVEHRTATNMLRNDSYIARKMTYLVESSHWLHWKGEAVSSKPMKNIFALLELELFCNVQLRLYGTQFVKKNDKHKGNYGGDKRIFTACTRVTSFGKTSEYW